MGKIDVNIRYANKAEIVFIKATMSRNLAFSGLPFKYMPEPIFFKEYAPLLDILIKAPGSVKVAVRAEPGSEDLILGYALYCGSVLHYIYVKKAFRGQGVAGQLWDTNWKTCSHLTEQGVKLISKRNLLYNPFKVE